MPVAQELNPGILLFNAPSTNTLEEDAIAFYSQEIEENPRNVHALVLRSELYRSLNMKREADADMNEALDRNPFARIYLYRDFREDLFPKKNYQYTHANTNDASGRFDKSIVLKEIYERDIHTLHGNTANENMIAALRAVIVEDYELLSDILENMSVEDQNTALYHDLSGLLHLADGLSADAIQSFSEAIKLNNEMASAYFNRAIVLKGSGYFDEAEADLIKSLHLQPEVAQIYFGKGKLNEMKGNKKEAANYYRTAMEKGVEYHEATANYSSAMKTEGEYAKALNAINDAIRTGPHRKENLYIRAGIYFVHGDYGKAIKDFDEYLSGGHQDNEALFFRGLCKVLSDSQFDGCLDMKESVAQGYERDQVEMIFYMCE